MKVNVVIELVGLCLTGAGLFFKVRLQKYFIVFAGLLLITGGFVYEANWIAVALCLLFGAFVTLNFVKTRRSFKEVRVVEIPLDDIYLNEFLRYYSKSIYNIFPFFELSETHKAFLLVREMNVAGVLLTVQEGDVLNIDVDFLKPEYRDYSVGNYIYFKNTGYFKRMGINTLKAKSYHYRHSNYLIKMGFKQTFLDGELVFIKTLN